MDDRPLTPTERSEMRVYVTEPVLATEDVKQAERRRKVIILSALIANDVPQALVDATAMHCKIFEGSLSKFMKANISHRYFATYTTTDQKQMVVVYCPAHIKISVHSKD